MPQAEEQLASADDVLGFVETVPDSLVRCRADRHEFAPQDVTAYTSHGNPTKDFRKAAALDIDEVCGNCGLVRHHTRSLRTRDRSMYTYSNHNPLLRAPAGVYSTGVSVRSELQHRFWSQYVQAKASSSARRAVKAA